jgi:hypothetical protein
MDGKKRKTHPELTVSPEPHDPRRALKRIEHDCDAAILAQMRDGLDAAAGEIHVPKRLVVDPIDSNINPPRRTNQPSWGGKGPFENSQAEILAALGADVDVARSGQRGGGDPQDLLREDPLVDLDCVRCGWMSVSGVTPSKESVRRWDGWKGDVHFRESPRRRPPFFRPWLRREMV